MTRLGQFRRCSRPCRYYTVRVCDECMAALSSVAYSNNPEARREFVAMVLG